MSVSESADVKISSASQNPAASIQLSDSIEQKPTDDSVSNRVGSVNGLNKDDMKELVDMLSKLNPMAKEFVPPSVAHSNGLNHQNAGYGYPSNFELQPNAANGNGFIGRRVSLANVDFRRIVDKFVWNCFTIQIVLGAVFLCN